MNNSKRKHFLIFMIIVYLLAGLAAIAIYFFGSAAIPSLLERIWPPAFLTTLNPASDSVSNPVVDSGPPLQTVSEESSSPVADSKNSEYTFRAKPDATQTNIYSLPYMDGDILGTLSGQSTGAVVEIGGEWTLIFTESGIGGYVANQAIDILNSAGEVVPAP